MNSWFNVFMCFLCSDNDVTPQYASTRTFDPLVGTLGVFADISAFVAESYLSVFQQVEWDSVLYRQIHTWCFRINGFQARTHFERISKQLIRESKMKSSENC
ncbi:Hypothetical_protein [Hexamita inflata]|uniref:Hypothetical_protein n=1 Tax=Hexamita inflata TaxID=28002 RepID=A0AA86Q801_9EUKA|nr:Hypothetical protein HINF_LOCUS38498 [Hexamita inflata]